MTLCWHRAKVSLFVNRAFLKWQRIKGAIGICSPWWLLAFSFHDSVDGQIDAFINGTFRFGPMDQYVIDSEVVRTWSYRDKIFTQLFLAFIKPTFKHLISPTCYHLRGPSGVKAALADLQMAMAKKAYPYVIRIDIKSYYASIDQKQLLDMVKTNFNDPRVLNYFEQIIHTAVDDGGRVFMPEQGIPQRSALSPFLGALYLDPLDRAFEACSAVFYARYMDDIIILCETYRQYKAAKKRLFRSLNALKLKLSPSKSRMGALAHFHFLGVAFEGSRKSSNQNPGQVVRLHARSILRAHQKAKALRLDGAPTPTIQSYISRWALWWAQSVAPDRSHDLILAFCVHIKDHDPPLHSLVRGLVSLPGTCVS